MGQTEIALTALHAAYETWLEVPVAISEFRHIASDDNLPTELDVLFFQPREEDVTEDSFFTYLVTAGMSTRTLEGPDRQIELGLQVVGHYGWDALHVLAIRLSELALAPFYQDAFYAPNQIVRDVRRHGLHAHYGLEYFSATGLLAWVNVAGTLAEDSAAFHTRGGHRRHDRRTRSLSTLSGGGDRLERATSSTSALRRVAPLSAYT